MKRALLATVLVCLIATGALGLTTSVSDTLLGEGNATDGIVAADYNVYEADDQRNGYLNVSVDGTFSATITLQRSFDDGSTWKDVDTFTASTEESLTDYEHGVQYRLTIKSGDYTSGNATVRLSH